jgi:uncharacterized protein YjbI with pentapeptide repeats
MRRMELIICVLSITIAGILFLSTVSSNAQEGTKISEAELSKIFEEHIKWHETERKEGQRADLRGVNLSGSNLRGANLIGAYLHKTDLEGANLEGASLQGADFWAADLEGANLRHGNLKGANLRHANLQHANLEEANLSFTNPWGANLEGANLTGANLEGAKLVWIALRGAEGLTIEQLSRAKTLYTAALDPELMEQVKEKCPHLLKEPKDADPKEGEPEFVE